MDKDYKNTVIVVMSGYPKGFKVRYDDDPAVNAYKDSKPYCDEGGEPLFFI